MIHSVNLILGCAAGILIGSIGLCIFIQWMGTSILAALTESNKEQLKHLNSRLHESFLTYASSCSYRLTNKLIVFQLKVPLEALEQEKIDLRTYLTSDELEDFVDVAEQIKDDGRLAKYLNRYQYVI